MLASLSLGWVREDLLSRGEPEEKDVPLVGLAASEHLICAMQSIQYPQCAVVLVESMVTIRKYETVEIIQFELIGV